MDASPHDDTGFSLVELLAAMAVLVVVSVAVAGGLLSSARASATSKSRTVAAALAAQEIELARSLPQTALTLGTTPPDPAGKEVGGRKYFVQRTVAWGSSAGVVNRCSGAGTGRYAFKRVTVTVTWLGMKGATPVTNETVITPAGGSGTPDTDSQRVHVVDSAGRPVPGAQAVLTGTSSTKTQTTDSYGCAVFIDVAPATYTLTVSKAGSVNTDGGATTTRTVSVAGTDTPPLVQVQLDVAGGVVVTPRSPNVNIPVALGLGASVGNPSMTGNRAAASATTTSTSTSIGGLFPFKNSSYSAWAGTCPDGSPGFYGAPVTAPVKVLPGQAGAAVDAPTMSWGATVKLGTGASNTYNNGVIYAVHPSASGCLQQVANPGVLGGTVAAVVRLQTDGNGQVRAALPYGHWRIEAPAGQGHIFNNSNGRSEFVLAPSPCSSAHLCDINGSTANVNLHP